LAPIDTLMKRTSSGVLAFLLLAGAAIAQGQEPSTPTNELSPDLLNKLHTAAQHVKANQLREALAAYTEFLSVRADMFTPYIDRGKVYQALKEHGKAAEDFSTAIKLKSDLFEAYLYRGIAYYDGKEYAKAIADCDKYVDSKPKKLTFEPFYYKGMAHAGLREYDKAMSTLKLAFELNNNLPEAHMLLGRLYTEQDQLISALREYTIVIQQRPGEKEAFKLRAQVKSSLGDVLGSNEDLAKSQ
jgi:tetratricopeptide (TPR) repeat protein